MMPQAAVKLIWSVAACNFCPRSDVRTCQIKPGKLLSKLSSALELDESFLDHSEGICTCCLADIDMIIRSIAIRGAMKDYFTDTVHNMRKGYNAIDKSDHFNGHEKSVICEEYNEDLLNSSLSVRQEDDLTDAPPPPALVARPPFPYNSLSEKQETMTEVLPLPSPITSTAAVTTPKKGKEKMTRYQCVLCDKIAGSKSHCMEHLICHSPVRPFTCSQCMRTYKSRKACREHLIVMHGVEKVEENLQRLVLVDHEDLKQLEYVCTQYRRIYSHGAVKSESDNSTPIPSFKTETTDKVDGGSAWLFKPSPGTHSRLPPPLLQCLPSASPAITSQKSSDGNEPTPPPSKRNRKGTPHKLIPDAFHETKTDLSLESENHEDLFDNQNGDSNAKHVSENFIDEDEIGFMSQEPPHLENLNQPFFPSFQQCKIEPSLPVVNRHSPTVMCRKALPPCKVCGRQFPTKEKMVDHMRSHSEIKQFSCLVCNRFFKYRRGVTNHLKEVHHMTDRVEISSKVASHEITCAVRKSPEHGRKSRKNISKEKPSESGISEKVIQDTLSSLADIQHTTDTANLPSQISSDESASLPDPDDSLFTSGDHSPNNDSTNSNEKVVALDDSSFGKDAIAMFTRSNPQSTTGYNWSSVNAAFTGASNLPSISSGATAVPDIATAAQLDSL